MYTNHYNNVQMCPYCSSCRKEVEEVPPSDSCSRSLSVSAKHQLNLESLKLAVEAAVLKTTGQLMYKIVVPADGSQLRWVLHACMD